MSQINEADQRIEMFFDALSEGVKAKDLPDIGPTLTDEAARLIDRLHEALNLNIAYDFSEVGYDVFVRGTFKGSKVDWRNVSNNRIRKNTEVPLRSMLLVPSSAEEALTKKARAKVKKARRGASRKGRRG